jgi:hypothetical protein
LDRCRDTLARATACEQLSTNSALVAHVAHCIASLRRFSPRAHVALSVAVDQRERIASVPRDFAGNAVSVVATTPIAARATAAELAQHLHARVEPYLRRPSLALETHAALISEVLQHRLPFSPLPGADMLGRGPHLLYSNSFQRFPIYDVDFGAARPLRPVRVIPHNLGDPIVFWPAPPSVGGIELYFSGRLAPAVARLDGNHPWWATLHTFRE